MISAFVLVNCHFPFDTGIMHTISKMPFVSIIHRTEGRYDLIIKIDVDTEDNLKDAISKNINTIRGVNATITLTIVSR
jgi:DNA-binding Lrp family transcriptional regulator